jgi:hypothetical protein
MVTPSRYNILSYSITRTASSFYWASGSICNNRVWQSGSTRLESRLGQELFSLGFSYLFRVSPGKTGNHENIFLVKYLAGRLILGICPITFGPVIEYPDRWFSWYYSVSLFEFHIICCTKWVVSIVQNLIVKDEYVIFFCLQVIILRLGSSVGRSQDRSSKLGANRSIWIWELGSNKKI